MRRSYCTVTILFLIAGVNAQFQLQAPFASPPTPQQALPIGSLQSFTLPPPQFKLGAHVPQPSDDDSPNDPDVSKCTSPSLSICAEIGWTDYGLALCGLRPKGELCQKYVPPTSCVSKALSDCTLATDSVTRSSLIALARILVTWCYDGTGQVLQALDQMHSCYAAALIHAVTVDGCVAKAGHKKGLVKSFIASGASEAGFTTKGVLNALISNFGATTIRCMYDSITQTCGQAAADLALKPAIDEFYLRQPEQEPITIMPNETINRHYNDSIDDMVEFSTDDANQTYLVFEQAPVVPMQSEANASALHISLLGFIQIGIIFFLLF